MFAHFREWLRPKVDFRFEPVVAPAGSTVVLRTTERIPSNALDQLKRVADEWANQKGVRVLIVDGSMDAVVNPSMQGEQPGNQREDSHDER